MMKMFDSVVIAYDQHSMDVALAVRSALELFRLNVYAHFCVQKKNIVELLAGDIPHSEYIVLCSHGLECTPDDMSEEPPDKMKMGFHVVDQIDGKWQKIKFALTPANIPEYVKLNGRTVIALGCGNGREPLAEAFLKAGCRAYAGAVSPVDQDSTALFGIAFFYHLLSQERDSSLSCSEQQAVERAAAIDIEFGEGTKLFRYYSQK